MCSQVCVWCVGWSNEEWIGEQRPSSKALTFFSGPVNSQPWEVYMLLCQDRNNNEFLTSFDGVSPAEVEHVRLLRERIGAAELERHPLHVSGDVALLRLLRSVDNDLDAVCDDFKKIAQCRDFEVRSELDAFEAWVVNGSGISGGVSFETIPGVAALKGASFGLATGSALTPTATS